MVAKKVAESREIWREGDIISAPLGHGLRIVIRGDA